jgi:IS30 family transposase
MCGKATCEEFREEVCLTRLKPPYVCNGCDDLRRCSLEKSLYKAADAQKTSEKKLSESRRGIFTTPEELSRINKLVTPLILRGNSVHQIYANHSDELMCSERTLYNYIEDCLLDVKSIDLPRKVRYRPRRKKREFKIDKGCYINRNYELYQAYMTKNPDIRAVQMDTMIGQAGGKVLLTIHFPETSFMLAYLREANTARSVREVFNHLYYRLGDKLFEKLFSVILTDRGSGFSNPTAIKKAPGGLPRTKVFYCDPSSPYQKGALEVNHEMIRRILPKGSSFDHLEQEDVTLMMNHINSYRRARLNDKTPFEAFAFYYGTDTLGRLGCQPVEPDDVLLRRRLLAK